MFTLLFSFIRVLILLSRPGGAKSVIAENLLLRQQLIVVGRKYKRSPNLTLLERIFLAFFNFFILPKRLLQIAIIIKPATIIKFHRALVKRKYRLLFTPKTKRKPGPKGPSKELINLIIEMKRKNPSYGCPRIAMQIQNSFQIDIDKDVVRRILKKYYKPEPRNDGPSWLQFIGSSVDSLWSIDFFRVESITLQSLWSMVVMDQYTRRIIGFAVHRGNMDGPAVCYMFNKIISGKLPPKSLSTAHDLRNPLILNHKSIRKYVIGPTDKKL